LENSLLFPPRRAAPDICHQGLPTVVAVDGRVFEAKNLSAALGARGLLRREENPSLKPHKPHYRNDENGEQNVAKKPKEQSWEEQESAPKENRSWTWQAANSIAQELGRTIIFGSS
jgi:hypothetical protein